MRAIQILSYIFRCAVQILAIILGTPAACAVICLVLWLSNADAMGSRGEILEYNHLGVDFVIGRSGCIECASVYAPKLRSNPNSKQSRAIGTHELVPGLGAYGLRIGDSVHVLSALPGVARKAKVVERGVSSFRDVLYGFEFRDGRRIQVTIRNDHVMSMIVLGMFRTPEGLTQAATEQDVRRLYGKPSDVIHMLSPCIRPALWPLTPVLALVCGAIGGVLLRQFHGRSRGGRAALVVPFALGFCFCVAAFLAGSYAATGGNLRWSLDTWGCLWSLEVFAGISGGTAACVLQLLLGYAGILTSRVLIVTVVTVAGIIAGYLARLVLPVGLLSIVTYAPLGVVLALFNFGLSLFGTRRLPQRVAEGHCTSAHGHPL